MRRVRVSILLVFSRDSGSVQRASERVTNATAECFEKAQIVSEVKAAFMDRGDSADFRTALQGVHSDFCLLQDGELECSPADYVRLLEPLVAGEADVTVGSRFRGTIEGGSRNRWMNSVTSAIASTELSDVELGFKAFRTSLAQSIPWRNSGAALQFELMIHFAKRRARIIEVAMDSSNGKATKTGIDKIRALRTILQTWLFASSYTEPGSQVLATLARAHRFNRWMADTIAPFVKGEVLELGAGMGNLTIPLATGRRRYVATDGDGEHIYELLARAAHQQGVEGAVFDFTEADEVERYCHSADTVICLNVLEHIEDDSAALAHIRRCLRPGGNAIVLVPHDPKLFGRIDEVLHHKRRYERQELIERMTDAGFKVQHVIEFNRSTRPGWYLNSCLLRRSTISPIQTWAFDQLVPLLRRIDIYLPWAPNSLIAIGAVE